MGQSIQASSWLGWQSASSFLKSCRVQLRLRPSHHPHVQRSAPSSLPLENTKLAPPLDLGDDCSLCLKYFPPRLLHGWLLIHHSGLHLITTTWTKPPSHHLDPLYGTAFQTIVRKSAYPFCYFFFSWSLLSQPEWKLLERKTLWDLLTGVSLTPRTLPGLLAEDVLSCQVGWR